MRSRATPIGDRLALYKKIHWNTRRLNTMIEAQRLQNEIARVRAERRATIRAWYRATPP